MNEIHHCQRCNRVIKNAKAIADGMGKVCKRKSLEKEKLAMDSKREGA